MKTYVSVDDVDQILGLLWSDGGKITEERAVLMANVWMTNQGLPEIDPIPEEWKQAASEIALEAVKGNIYDSKETGVISKSVTAGDVSSSKTFSSTAKNYTAGEAFALALLAPWKRGASNVIMLKRV